MKDRFRRPPRPGDHRLITLRRVVASVSALALVASVVAVTSVVMAPSAAAAPAMLCDQNTLYGIDVAGQVAAINVTTGVATNLVDLSPAVNGLAVTNGGTDAYGFDGSHDTVVRYRASTGAVSTVTAVDSNPPGSIIRGAYDPQNGLYYYSGGGNTAYLGAYNTLTSTKIGQVGSITGLASGTGDFAFSTGGLLFVAASNTVVRVNGTVPSIAGRAALTTSLVATLPRGTNSPGIAFSSDGYLYVTAGSALIKLDPASGAQVGASKTLSGGFAPFDLASCNYANTISVMKNVVERIHATDQFKLSVVGGSIVSGNTATTSGTAEGVQPDVAGAVLAISGRVYRVAETAAGTTNLADYTSAYSCENVNDNTVIATGSGTSGSFTFPAAVTASGTDVACTFTNTPNATVALTKVLGTTRNAAADQFTVAIRAADLAGAVVNSTAASTTTGSGSTVTPGSGTTGATTVLANRPFFFTEAMADGSASVLAQYQSTITCVDGNNLQSGLPSAAAFTGSLSITPVSNSAITCTLSNSGAPPVLRSTVVLGSARFAAGNQFTVAVRTGSATGPVLNPTADSTTTGTGSTVTAGSGTTGTDTGTNGNTYYFTQSASADGPRYSSTITCTDSNDFQTGLPTDTAFTGSLAITPVAGSLISCTVTNTRAPAVLALAIVNPPSLTDDVPATYDLTVINTGGEASTGSTIKDQLPADVAYVSASGTGWRCSATGTVAAGQVVTCSGPAISPPGSSTLILTVQPDAAASGTTAVNKAAVDTTGGPDPVDPTTCAADAIPAVGCAVTPGLLVGAGVSLSLAEANPVGLTVGVAADYTLTITDNGSSAADSATVTDLLPPGLRFLSAGGARCHAIGQQVRCTLSGPIAAGGGSQILTVTVVPTPGSAGRPLINRATVDPSGGARPSAPAGCTSTGVPAGCAVAPALRPGTAKLTILASAALLPPASGGARIGDRIRYRFLVTNSSGAGITAIAVNDLAAGAVSCPAPNLAAHRSMTCTAADYTVTQTDVDAGSVASTATGSGRLQGCTRSGCILAASPSSTLRPTYSVTDVAATTSWQWIDRNGDARTDQGDVVRYTLRVSNIGTRTADLRVYDPLLTLNCPRTILAPGQSVWCTGDLVIDAAQAAVRQVVNTATVTVTGGPGHRQVRTATNTVITRIQPARIQSARVPPAAAAPAPALPAAIPSAPVAPASTVQRLPTTGVPAGEQLMIAVLLMLSGSVLLVSARRRRRS